MAKQVNSKQSSNKFSLYTILPIFFIILLGIIVIIQTYYNFAQRRLCKDAATIGPAVTQLQTKVAEQQLILEAWQNKFQDLSKDKEKSINYWVLVKINYLIQTAKFYLVVERNLPEAIKFLTMAELNAANMKEQIFTPLREALAHDLKNLQSYSVVNIPDIAMQIDTLNQQINKLYVLPKDLAAQPSLNGDEIAKKYLNDEKEQKWQTRLWQRILLVFRKAFIIRRQISPESLLLLPEQNYHMVLQMQSKLDLAKWGWLHYNNNLYQTNLQQLANMLQNYLPHLAPNDAANILLKVKELQKNNIPETSPNILDASLQAMQTALKQQ